VVVAYFKTFGYFSGEVRRRTISLKQSLSLPCRDSNQVPPYL